MREQSDDKNTFCSEKEMIVNYIMFNKFVV